MRHVFILSASLVASLSAALLSFAQGYYANPGFLLDYLGFIGGLALFIAPLLQIGLLVLPLGILIWYVVRFFRRKLAAQNGMLALAALIIVAVPPATVPGDFEAFAYRMKSFPERQYLELGATLKQKLDKRGMSSVGYGHFDGRGGEFHDSLVVSHPILAFSDFKPKISTSDNRVTIAWGSGLLGGYEAVILLTPAEPGWHKEPAHSSVTYIYDHVALLRLP